VVCWLLQYLCCELAALQLSRQLCQLQVFDVAHTAWRLQIGCELEAAIDAYQQVWAPAETLHISMTCLHLAALLLATGPTWCTCLHCGT
jgi:hypothetical protein